MVVFKLDRIHNKIHVSIEKKYYSNLTADKTMNNKGGKGNNMHY